MAITHSDLFGKKLIFRIVFIYPLFFLLVIFIMSSNSEWGTSVMLNSFEILPILLSIFSVIGLLVPIATRLFFEQKLKNDSTDFGKLIIIQSSTEIPLIFGFVLAIMFQEIVYFMGFFVLTYLLMFWNFRLIKVWEEKIQQNTMQMYL